MRHPPHTDDEVRRGLLGHAELVNNQGTAHNSEVRQSASFLTNLFIYMRRSAERKIALIAVTTERRAHVAIRNAIGFIAKWMHACHSEVPTELRPFVELCVSSARETSMQSVNSTFARTRRTQTAPHPTRQCS